MTTASPTATLGPKPTVSPYVRNGCYTEVAGRALTGASFADDTMTLEECASKCVGFYYFAAEYGRECQYFMSINIITKHVLILLCRLLW
jgi:hypothetical protein